MNTYTTARGTTAKPEAILQEHFGSKARGPCDAVFADSGERFVAGVSGLPFRVPVMEALFANASFARYAEGIFRDGESLLVVAGERPREGSDSISAPPEFFAAKNRKVRALAPESGIKSLVAEILDSVRKWGGHILVDGSQVIDLKSPLPGPHFAVNLLLGNRAGFPYPLQTTPKSVVDRLGRGSFRSHAATQVLATRWDLRQEENGFPCNRQFYLFENGRQIFYSADPAAPGVVDARCEHAQNRTVIRYSLDCGLEVTRTIFILPQEEGLPIAVEAQRIEIANRLPRTRDIRLVTVGMFGPSKPGALQEDVLYSTIIMESGLLRTDDGDILAVSPSYWPEQDRYDRRFNSLVLHDARGMALPREFSFDYTAFVGNGTLERPDGAGFLRNRQNRKGPGFFALSGTLVIAGGERAVADSFTGLVSSRGNPSYDESSLEREASQLFARYSDIASVPRAPRSGSRIHRPVFIVSLGRYRRSRVLGVLQPQPAVPEPLPELRVALVRADAKGLPAKSASAKYRIYSHRCIISTRSANRRSSEPLFSSGPRKFTNSATPITTFSGRERKPANGPMTRSGSIRRSCVTCSSLTMSRSSTPKPRSPAAQGKRARFSRR